MFNGRRLANDLLIDRTGGGAGGGREMALAAAGGHIIMNQFKRNIEVEVTSEGGHLERVHLGESDDEGEFLIVDAEFEERPPADDLQRREDDAADVHVADEHVAGHLSDVLQEGEVEMLVLEPSQFQVAVHVGAVGVTVAQVAVVVFPVGRHRHPTVGSDTNCQRHNNVLRLITHRKMNGEMNGKRTGKNGAAWKIEDFSDPFS